VIYKPPTRIACFDVGGPSAHRQHFVPISTLKCETENGPILTIRKSFPFVKTSLFISINLIGSTQTVGQGLHHERGTVQGIATDDDVLWILRMDGLEEPHDQQHQLGLCSARRLR